MAYGDGVVDWEKLGATRYERMVSVLLNTLHPNIRRVDGAGGDGGRDCYFPTEGSNPAFELKSFTGRLGDSQRRQIKLSLERSEKNTPSSWTLVVPIDLNPSEQEWFDKLVTDKPFLCDHHGLTWLDARMIEHPAVYRYFVEEPEHRVVELLSEMNAAQAKMKTADDLVERLRQLASRADEIDPYYGLTFSIDPDHRVSVSAVPRYLGAENDCPIVASANLAIPVTPEGTSVLNALVDAHKYGTGAVVPAEYVTNVSVTAPAGLGGEKGPGQIVLSPNSFGASDASVDVSVISPTGERLSSLPLRIVEQVVGTGGMVLYVTDPASCLRGELRIDGVGNSLTFHHEASLPPSAIPAVALPLIEWLATLCDPNQMEFRFEGTPIGPPAPVGRESAPISRGFLDFVRALARVQAFVKDFFDLPKTIGDEDAMSIATLDSMIAGESIPISWSETIVTVDLKAVVESAKAGGIDVLGGKPFSQFVVRPYTPKVFGRTLQVGMITEIRHSAVLENRGAASSALAQGATEFEIHTVPGNAATGEVRLGVPDNFDSSLAEGTGFGPPASKE